MRRIRITICADGTPILFSVLQNGITIRAEVGCTLRAFLTSVFSVTPHYVGSRLQTILLDGKAVDHPDETIVEDGATLALSTAMPGLAGATLRSGGHLAGMRGGITHGGRHGSPHPRPGTVSVKLFNVLIRELGIPLLERGIEIPGRRLAALVEATGGDLLERCIGVTVDGSGVTVKELLEGERLREIAGEAAWCLKMQLGTP